MKPQYLVLAWVLTGIAAPLAAQQARCPQALLEIGFNGNVMAGSKAAVVAASQRGQQLQVGWDLDFNGDAQADLSHWSDLRFVSIIKEEVYGQVHSIHRQTPDIDNAHIKLPEKLDIWHGLIGTNGVLQGRFESSEKTMNHRVRSVWCSLSNPVPIWQAVYRNGINGESLAGSKERLISAIRAGQPIRIGWGLARQANQEVRSVEHVISPVFITVTDGTEVVAQLPEHIAQLSYWDAGQAFFEQGSVMWRGLMSSTGSFDAIWVDRGSGATVRRIPQRAALTWYTLLPMAESVPPLAVEGGVIRDTNRADEIIPARR